MEGNNDRIIFRRVASERRVNAEGGNYMKGSLKLLSELKRKEREQAKAYREYAKNREDVIYLINQYEKMLRKENANGQYHKRNIGPGGCSWFAGRVRKLKTCGEDRRGN